MRIGPPDPRPPHHLSARDRMAPEAAPEAGCHSPRATRRLHPAHRHSRPALHHRSPRPAPARLPRHRPRGPLPPRPPVQAARRLLLLPLLLRLSPVPRLPLNAVLPPVSDLPARFLHRPSDPAPAGDFPPRPLYSTSGRRRPEKTVLHRHRLSRRVSASVCALCAARSGPPGGAPGSPSSKVRTPWRSGAAKTGHISTISPRSDKMKPPRPLPEFGAFPAPPQSPPRLRRRGRRSHPSERSCCPAGFPLVSAFSGSFRSS